MPAPLRDILHAGQDVGRVPPTGRRGTCVNITALNGWPGVGVLQTVTLARGAEIGGRRGQGKVSGLRLMTSPIGAIAGGLLGGWVGQQVGLQAVFDMFVPAFAALFLWQWRAPDAAP